MQEDIKGQAVKLFGSQVVNLLDATESNMPQPRWLVHHTALLAGPGRWAGASQVAFSLYFRVLSEQANADCFSRTAASSTPPSYSPDTTQHCWSRLHGANTQAVHFQCHPEAGRLSLAASSDLVSLQSQYRFS